MTDKPNLLLLLSVFVCPICREKWVDCQHTVQQILDGAFEQGKLFGIAEEAKLKQDVFEMGEKQGKLAERERLNAIVVFDKEHKIDWYASYKLLKSQLNEGEKHGEKV